MSANETGTSVPELVLQQFDVAVAGPWARFEEQEWSFQGASSVVCDDCISGGPLHVYRKPYTTTQGDYRYWAIVCLDCRTIRALVDLSLDVKKQLRRWDVADAVGEIDPSEEDAREPAPDEMDAMPTPGSVETASTEEAPAVAPPRARAGVAPEALAAARAELEASRGATRLTDVGEAVAEPSDGRFRVNAPEVDLSEQPPGELFLAANADSPPRYLVAQLHHASRTEAVVSSAVEVPETGEPLRLFLRIDPAVVAEAFVRHLEGCERAGLASAMTGELPLSVHPPASVAGLNSEQNAAVGALSGPGATALWGPPGTGKTRVIGESVARLLAAGRTVAVVSNTNVAVDQAL